MPILEVEIVLRPGESLNPELARELADNAALVFQSPPGTTWVKVKPIASGNYAENGGGPEHSVSPVFVSVLKAALPAPNPLQAEVTHLTAVVAKACMRPAENVHIIYVAEVPGRVAFGGRIVHRSPSKAGGESESGT
jgi:phenylpyruvate tautomerase PptA (4-oxalocrotonate tautomerase family)